MVDIFQGDILATQSTDSNYLMLDTAWKWLPEDGDLPQRQQGYIFYLNDAEAVANNKATSYPPSGHGRLARSANREDVRRSWRSVTPTASTRRRLDRRVSGEHLRGSGVHAAPHDAQPDRGRLSARLHERGHRFVLVQRDRLRSYVQQIAGRFALDLSGRYVHRNYGGQFVDTTQDERNDNFFQVGATLDYFVRNWIYFGVGYSLLSNTATSQPWNT